MKQLEGKLYPREPPMLNPLPVAYATNTFPHQGEADKQNGMAERMCFEQAIVYDTVAI